MDSKKDLKKMKKTVKELEDFKEETIKRVQVIQSKLQSYQNELEQNKKELNSYREKDNKKSNHTRYKDEINEYVLSHPEMYADDFVM